MNWYKSKIHVLVVIALLLLMQSCTAFRTHIDQACASRFVNEYSSPQESHFVLPWRVGESYTLTQGNCTLETHNLVGKQHMAFDFKMPIGTPIVAISDGRIAMVVDSFKDNIDSDFSQANFIGIEHEGGILSWYGHLKFKGAIVQVDDNVSQGDVIGYSGNTGDSAYPHLHFYAQQLTDECYNSEDHSVKLEQCPQLPVSFKNASPSEAVLTEFVSYTALAY